MNRAAFFIKLIFAIAVTALIITVPPAFAVETQAERAIQLLAKSQLLDRKCRFLDAADHDELASLVARAEVALAKRTTVATTRAALAQGENAAKLASCTASERADLVMILSSAKQAAAQATGVAAVPTVTRGIKATEKRSVKVALATVAPAPSQRAANVKSGLMEYAVITERYYLARRCGSMSPPAISSFYKAVVSLHQSVLSSFGRSAVARVMKQSEAKANMKTCG